jgi:uncharacterized protein YndB with AHSA1/START domain
VARCAQRFAHARERIRSPAERAERGAASTADGIGFAGTTSTLPNRSTRNMMMKTNLGEAVVIERTFNAPVAKVWRAITDVDQMRAWYFDLKEFTPEVGFEFEFSVEHEGMTYHHLCRITEVVPQKKIAYTWRYKGEPGDSLVTFELFAEDDNTRVKLTHTGIATFPKTPAYARKNFESGWTAIIGTELKQFVEQSKKGKS